MDSDNVMEYVDNKGLAHRLNLPHYPKVVAALDEGIRQNADISSISNLIGKDPAMSQMVLKIINSPLFGMRSKITSVNHAVSLIGADKVRILVLTPKLQDALLLQTDVSEFLWRRSVMNALCASKLTTIVEGIDRDDAYTAGMFQNSGSMILHKNFNNYEQVFTSACEKAKPVHVEELEHYGTSNILIASSFAKKWTLPLVVATTLLIQGETDYSEISDKNVRGLNAVLTLSNFLVNEVLNEHKEKYIWHFCGNCSSALDELVVQEALFVELGEEIKADLNDELNDLESIH
ncbi:MAG: HDOD domain-containing protein [Proteobacteria bacterium]|nr:HDOD domain-containing protein [Pseudomonadota bacterium]NOG61171.1 HDOD domain-containing protein [Pseudomonadota bacterium]